MCLAIPARVVSIIDGNNVIVDTFGNQAQVNTMLIGDVNLEDYVLVHAGFAIEIIDQQAAEESLALWREIYATEST